MDCTLPDERVCVSERRVQGASAGWPSSTPTVHTLEGERVHGGKGRSLEVHRLAEAARHHLHPIVELSLDRGDWKWNGGGVCRRQMLAHQGPKPPPV